MRFVVLATVVVLAAACSGGAKLAAHGLPGKPSTATGSGGQNANGNGGQNSGGGGTGTSTTTGKTKTKGGSHHSGSKGSGNGNGSSSSTTSTTGGGSKGSGSRSTTATTSGGGGGNQGGTTTTTTGGGGGTTTTTTVPAGPTGLQVVEATAQQTLDAGSTDVNFTFTIQPGCSAFSGQTITGTITGQFSFTKAYGSLSLETPDGTTNLLGDILDGTGGADDTPALYVGKTLYVEPLPGSLAADVDGGKQYASVNLTSAASVIGVDLNGLGSLLGGNPASFIQIFDTTAMTVYDDGAAQMGGVQTTHYHVDINLAEAAAQGGREKYLYAALAKVPGQSTLGIDVWIDGKGRAAAINVDLKVPSTTGTPIGLTLSVQQTNFGVSVPTVKTPPADDVGTIPSPPPLC